MPAFAKSLSAILASFSQRLAWSVLMPTFLSASERLVVAA